MGKKESTGRWGIFNFGGPKNLTKQPVPNSKVDASDQIIAWEVLGAGNYSRNNFPQQLIQNVYNSPVGSAALDVWQEFIEGDGFVIPEVGDIQVNNDHEDDKLKDLHAKVSADMALLWGFAVHISYGPDGQKKELKHLPFEQVRLGLIDNKTGKVKNIAYNPYFGIPQDKYTIETKYFYPYNPDPAKVVEEMTKHADLRSKGKIKEEYPGQVYWYSIERPLARVYPQPFYYSSINWFIIDNEIQKFHERNIDNNFLLSVMINIFGDPDAPAGPESEDSSGDKKDQYETAGEVFNKQMKEQFSGSQNGGSAFVNWFKRDEEKAEILPFPTNSHHDLFLALQKLTTDQICIGTKVPPVLISIREAGKLGDTQEILNAIRVMQGRTRRQRNILASKYKMLLQGMTQANGVEDYDIKNVVPFNILPQWAITELTNKERREYINEHFPIAIDTEIQITTEGSPAPIQQPVNMPMRPEDEDPKLRRMGEIIRGMTGKQYQQFERIQRKFNQGKMTYEQAAALLRQGFGFDDEIIDLFLVTQEEEETEPELA